MQDFCLIYQRDNIWSNDLYFCDNWPLKIPLNATTTPLIEPKLWSNLCQVRTKIVFFQKYLKPIPALMKKCGLIKPDEKTGEAKLKLYRDKEVRNP